jgi:hypothetical protein
VGKNKKYRSVGFSVGKRSAGLCPVTANCQPSQGQSERWFESQKFHSSDVSPLVVVSSFTLAGNVSRLALSGVAPTPSHYKYNKTFHSAADFPQENPEVAIEANRC